MKKLSIKTQLTLYYGMVMSLLVLTIIALLFTYASHQIKTQTENALYDQVHDAIGDIKVKNQKLSFGNDLMYQEDGIYLSVYDEQKDMLYGRVPYGFTCDDGFHTDMKTSKQGQITYMVYDFAYFPDGITKIYIRGVASLSAARSSMEAVLQTALIFLPSVILICLFIGYLLAKKALSPVATITSKVNDILNTNDINKRIHLGEGRDEIYEMAHTFDDLLNQLQNVITREQQFTSDVSHELRTPISVILMQCEHLLEDSQELSSQELKDIQVIQQKAKSMHQMISQLLLLSRADAGRAQIETESIDLSELCEMVCDEHIYNASQKHIEIKTHIEKYIHMDADQTLMIRLLSNLISNAITYGKEHGWIQVDLTSKDTQIELMITDNGIGISEEDLPHIFQRFYQADSSRTSSNCGLGLSMVKWICEAHHGQLEVQSKLHEGTQFKLVFPITSNK